MSTVLTLKNVHSLDKSLLVEWTIVSGDYMSVTGGVIRLCNETTKVLSQIVLSDAEMEGESYTIKNLVNGQKYTVSLFYNDGSFDGALIQSTNASGALRFISAVPSSVPEAPQLSFTQIKGPSTTEVFLNVKIGNDNGSKISKIIVSRFHLTEGTPSHLPDLIFTVTTTGQASSDIIVSDGEYALKVFTKKNSDYVTGRIYLLSATSVNEAGPSVASNTIEVNTSSKPSKPLPFKVSSFGPNPTITITDPQAKSVKEIEITGISSGVVVKNINLFNVMQDGSLVYKLTASESATALSYASSNRLNIRITYISIEGTSSDPSEIVRCVIGNEVDLQDIDNNSVVVAAAASPSDGSSIVSFIVPELKPSTLYTSSTTWNVKMYLNNQLIDNSNGSFRPQASIRTSVSGRLILKGGDLLRFDYMASAAVPQVDLELLPSGTSNILSSRLFSHSHVVPSAPDVPLIKSLMPFYSSTASAAEKYGVLLELEPAPSMAHNKATDFEYQIRFADPTPNSALVWIGGNNLQSNGTGSDVNAAVSLSRGINVLKAASDYGANAIFADGKSLQFRVRGKNSAATPSAGDWSDWSLMVTLGTPASVVATDVDAVSVTKTLNDANFGVKVSWGAPNLTSLAAGNTFMGWTLKRVDRDLITTLAEDTKALEFMDSLSDTSFRTVTYLLQAKTRNDLSKIVTLSAPKSDTQVISDNPSISIPEVVRMSDGDHIVFRVKVNASAMGTSYAVGVPALDSPESVSPVKSFGASSPDANNFVSYDVNLGYNLGPEKSFMLIMVNNSGLSSILKNNM
jgi:hypothetical protein